MAFFLGVFGKYDKMRLFIIKVNLIWKSKDENILLR